MSQSKPEEGEVFINQDRRTERPRLRLLTRVNPRGDTPPYWVAAIDGTSSTTTIREDRLVDPGLYKHEAAL